MKKRLLSALLALVMVLALLPVNVFAEGEGGTTPTEPATQTDTTPADTTGTDTTPTDTTQTNTNQQDTDTSPVIPRAPVSVGSDPEAGSTHNGMTARYIDKNAEAKTNASGEVTSTAITGAPGYYVVDTTTTRGQTAYYKITRGYVVSNKYYYDTNVDGFPANPTNVVVIGGSGTIQAGTTRTLTIDVYGSGSSVAVNGANLTTVNVTDTKYYDELAMGVRTTKNTVTLNNTWADDRSAVLNLTNVTVTSQIRISGPYTHTVKLDNADATNGIELNGVGTIGTRAVSAAQTVTVNAENATYSRGSTVGNISVTGNGSKVTLVDVTTGSPTVDLVGTGTSLTVGGRSAVGNVTISDSLAAAATTTYSTITVNSGSVGNISLGTGKCTGAVAVKVNSGTVGNIDLSRGNVTTSPKPTITVTGATAGAITIDNGTLSVSSSETNKAKVGALNLSGSASFTLSGSYADVGAIAVSGSNVKISVPAEPTNELDIATNGLDAYKGGNILGGTWNAPVPKAALSSTLVYQLGIGGNSYTYYNADQLASALVSQYKNNGSILCRVGETPTADNSYNLVFMNGKTVWGTLKVTGEMQIKLPSLVNTVTVTRWADARRSYGAGAMYPTPAVSEELKTSGWELNASGGITSGDITKLTGVSVTNASWNVDAMGYPKATLSGTTITLTGAVPKGDSTMRLTLTTDAVEKDPDDENKEIPVTLDVGVTYFGSTKTLIFSNVTNESLGHGATLETDESGIGILRLSNGTKYTLNGTGLKERSDKITVLKAGQEDTFGNNFIEVSINVSTLKTQADKDAVIELLNGSGASFKWGNSPAMKEAINAALSTITDSQVDNWVSTAKRTAWTKVNTGTYTDAKGNDTNYTEAYLVPYLQVNVTGYNPNGSLTATLVPSWRVEIRQSTATGDRYETAFADPRNPNLPGNAYIAKSGSALQLSGNACEEGTWNRGISVTFSNLFAGKTVYMHQDNTYAYARNGQEFVIRHLGASGGSLGTVVINEIEPLVTLYKANQRDKLAYYNTLQAAVDDAVDGQYIDVDQNYKGSTSVTMSGNARKIYIQTNGNNVVIANASGGLVDLNSTGGLYTVQLNRDNTAVADPNAASIAVTNVTGGTAVVSATSAKAGTTITVTCTPATGYRTSSVSVSAHMTKTNTNSAVAVTRSSENVYTFKVPEGASSITVTPSFVLNTGMPFTDVAATDYYYSAVKYVYDNGLMNGNNATGTLFDGNSTLTRAMVVTILYRAAGSPSSTSYNNFTDVPNNTWYTQAVTWGNQNGIVTGDGNGTFRPTDAITRQELATILYRYNTTYKGRPTTGSTTLANYTDQGYVSSWATAGMQWAVGNGIVNGTTTTTLTPGGNATRYQAATMLMRYGQNFGL